MTGQGSYDEAKGKADSSGVNTRQSSPPAPPPHPVISPTGYFELQHLTFNSAAPFIPQSINWPPLFELRIDVAQSFVDKYIQLPDVQLSIALTGRNQLLNYGVKTGAQIVPIQQDPNSGSQPWQMQRRNYAGGAHGYWLEFNIHYPTEGMAIQIELHANVDHQIRRGCDHVLVWQGGQIHPEKI